MGGVNGSAHTQAWSSYGEVHETVGTVCEYNVEESGITETIAAVYQSQEACTGTPYLRPDTQAWSFYGEDHETKQSLHCWPAPQETWVRPRVPIQIQTPPGAAVSSGLVHSAP